MKKKIFFYLFLMCAGKIPVALHAQQNLHETVHAQVSERSFIQHEGYDALDHAFEACEAQPKPRFTMPEWIVSLGITLAIKYFEVQEFVGEKWQRLKELLRKKRTHGTTIKA